MQPSPIEDSLLLIQRASTIGKPLGGGRGGGREIIRRTEITLHVGLAQVAPLLTVGFQRKKPKF